MALPHPVDLVKQLYTKTKNYCWDVPLEKAFGEAPTPRTFAFLWGLVLIVASLFGVGGFFSGLGLISIYAMAYYFIAFILWIKSIILG